MQNSPFPANKDSSPESSKIFGLILHILKKLICNI